MLFMNQLLKKKILLFILLSYPYLMYFFLLFFLSIQKMVNTLGPRFLLTETDKLFAILQTCIQDKVGSVEQVIPYRLLLKRIIVKRMILLKEQKKRTHIHSLQLLLMLFLQLLLFQELMNLTFHIILNFGMIAQFIFLVGIQVRILLVVFLLLIHYQKYMVNIVSLQ